MHPAPLVDRQTLELLRRRLAWGLLGLEQPATDLIVALQHFSFRWSQSQPPPALHEWQRRVLSSWRQAPKACQGIALEPVLEVLVRSLQLEDDSSLDGWFTPALFQLARNEVEPQDLKPVLRHSWQQLSQGVARLRQGLGPFSSEGEQSLRAVLAALQQIQYYFQSPDVKYLEEAGWRWTAAINEWDLVANLCLTGLQPASSCIYWGQLLDHLSLEEELQALAQGQLSEWFENWATDLVHTVAPYLMQILGVEPALESLGMRMLRWQKLLPGWTQEVAPQWAEFVQAIPPLTEERQDSHIFRWLEPEISIEEGFVRRNPWRAWLRQASQIPPRGPAADDARRLEKRLRLGRLLCTLVEPSFTRCAVEFPEVQWIQEAGDWVGAWLEGYDPLSESAAQRVEQRLAQLERLILRDFPVANRNAASEKA